MFIKSMLGMSTLLLSMASLNAVEINQNNTTPEKKSNEVIQTASVDNAIAAWQKKLSYEGYYVGEINGISSPELNRATKWYLRDRI